MKSLKLNRVTTIASTVVCLLCSLPQNGIAAVVPIEQLAKDLSAQQTQFPLNAACIAIPSSHNSEKSVTNLVDTIRAAEDPLSAARQFLTAFLKQINQQNGTSISLEEACQLLRQNIDLVPIEYREIVLMGTETIEMKQSHIDSTSIPAAHSSLWLWLWNWYNQKPEERVDYAAVAKNFIANISPEEIIVFAIIAVTVTVVAIHNPGAVGTAAQALTEVAKAIL